CNNLAVKSRTLLKNKIGIASTTPNSIIHNKEKYDIDLWSRQAQHHITNLLTRINDDTLVGGITEIRMRQLQLKEWLPTCPTE
ncbi:7372_t:CDS:1, partial [Entrophospora sp. SA101]